MSTQTATDPGTATLIRIRVNLSNRDICRNVHRLASLHKTVMLLGRISGRDQ